MKKRSILLTTLAALVVAMLVLVGAAWAEVSSNPNPISIPASGQATPYPATLDVSGRSGAITDLNVTLRGVSHTFTDDVAALLVGPSGQKVMLMSDVGGGQDLNGVNLTFDDEATRSLPDGAGTQITTGSYKPTQGATSAYKVPASLPAPAPAGPYGGSLSAFNGTNPNGTYALYVFDDAPGDSGQIASGFDLDISTGTSSSSISIPASGQATPYPATLDVSGRSGTITDLNVTLRGVSHTFTDDVAALLVGPSGQKVMLMSDVGGGQDLNGVNLTFDDEATRSLPDGAGTQITTGSYKPTQGATSAYKVPASLPAPAPAGPYGGSLSAFNGTNPNGTYALYVFDDAPGDSGQIASGFDLDISTGTSSNTDRLPDLGMDKLTNIQIQNTNGQQLLRFDTRVVNIGAGAFEAHGSRPDTSTETMSVEQRIFDNAGGHRDVPTVAQMYYSGDGHNHWHLRDLESYTLDRLDNGVKVGTGAKEGFCFFDNYYFGSTADPYYLGCANNQPDALNVTMGLSRGWGDTYGWQTVGQYIDVTNLTSGRYRLEATADKDNLFTESNETNNSTYADVQLQNGTVSVLSYGPSAQPISG